MNLCTDKEAPAKFDIVLQSSCFSRFQISPHNEEQNGAVRDKREEPRVGVTDVNVVDRMLNGVERRIYKVHPNDTEHEHRHNRIKHRQEGISKCLKRARKRIEAC